MPSDKTLANPDVLAFYRELPFDFMADTQAQADAIAGHTLTDEYPTLIPLLPLGARVLDVGCSVGHLALKMAYHYGVDVTGIDFNPVAIERARHQATFMGLDATFNCTDLFTYPVERAFKVVTSVGVLHHTNDCLAGLRHICRSYVAAGGHVMIGLYHTHGRRPFLDHFRSMRESGASEDAMLNRYKQLHDWIGDELEIRSWFRDQVLHPHETQHTLKEVAAVFGELGMEITSTSINRYAPIDDLDALFDVERTLEAVGRQRLLENRYFPGFFIVTARKR